MKKTQSVGDMAGIIVVTGGFFFLNSPANFGLPAAEAAAKAPPSSSSTSNTPTKAPALTTPTPIRDVVLQPVGAQAFQLPNGVSVDMGVDLQSIWNTVVTATNTFSPLASPQFNPCGTELELTSDVSNFQLNIAQLGITFGFSPAGPIGPLSGITGSANVNIGAIAMDFGVWSCSPGSSSSSTTAISQCTEVLSSSANQSTAGVNLNVTVDFTSANTAANFVYNTPIGSAMQTIMASGANQLASAARLSALPWQASVDEAIPSSGPAATNVVFNAGMQSGIGINQTFEIYAPVDTSSSGVCNVYQVVADIHTTVVDTVSSTAVIDNMVDPSRGVLPGDVVMIRNAGVK